VAAALASAAVANVQIARVESSAVRMGFLKSWSAAGEYSGKL
jgi:hypothetical protein